MRLTKPVTNSATRQWTWWLHMLAVFSLLVAGATFSHASEISHHSAPAQSSITHSHNAGNSRSHETSHEDAQHVGHAMHCGGFIHLAREQMTLAPLGTVSINMPVVPQTVTAQISAPEPPPPRTLI